MASKRTRKPQRSEEEREERKSAQKAKLELLLESLEDNLEHEAPEGWTKQLGDTAGQWVRCSPIQGIPRSAKLMDSNMDEEKSAALVLIELTAPCVVDVEGEFQLADVGQVVGVWYKPGMRALRWLRDVEVWMKESGTKPTGKQNDMITFDIRAPERGSPMLILEDFRETSAPFQDATGKTLGLHDLEPVQRAIQRVPI